MFLKSLSRCDAHVRQRANDPVPISNIWAARRDARAPTTLARVRTYAASCRMREAIKPELRYYTGRQMPHINTSAPQI